MQVKVIIKKRSLFEMEEILKRIREIQKVNPHIQITIEIDLGD